MDDLNPFLRGYVPPEPASEPEKVATATPQTEPLRSSGPMITEPGAYQDISAEDYHGNANLLPGPSLSSSGAKTLINKSPLHFWHESPMNPMRPEESDKAHLAVGRAAHDVILLRERWKDFYHILPPGFSRAKSNQFRDEISEADEAKKAGLTLLKHDDSLIVHAVADALMKNQLALDCLADGVTEETLAWRDPNTGVWLRARPDFRPNSLLTKQKVMIVPDLKFVAPTYASPEGFERMINQFGYHQSAALYSDGIKAIYGHYPSHWLHIVIEKEAPHCVALYDLPGEDIERGRVLNRRAIDKFAECLESGKWPGYADTPKQVGLSGWARSRIEVNPNELAMAAAA